MSAKSNFLGTLKVLIKYCNEVDINAHHEIDGEQWCPIHLAASEGHLQVVKFLAGVPGMKLGHNVENDHVDHVLHAAARGGHRDIIEFLVSEVCA